jgi:hypothetical protein
LYEFQHYQGNFELFAAHIRPTQINQHQVIVRTPTHKVVPSSFKPLPELVRYQEFVEHIL